MTDDQSHSPDLHHMAKQFMEWWQTYWLHLLKDPDIIQHISYLLSRFTPSTCPPFADRSADASSTSSTESSVDVVSALLTACYARMDELEHRINVLEKQALCAIGVPTDVFN